VKQPSTLRNSFVQASNTGLRMCCLFGELESQALIHELRKWPCWTRTC